MMERVKSIVEQGKTIVHTDLSGLTMSESIEVMQEAVRVVLAFPEKSILSIVDMTDMRFNKEIIGKITEIAKANAPFVIATVVVGLTPLTKLIGKSVIQLSGRNVKFLNSVKDAKQWLLTSTI